MKQRDEPEFYAAQRADELMAAGDLEGFRVWQRIGFAIRNLQGPRSSNDGPLPIRERKRD
jgi:hypothetical protein